MKLSHSETLALIRHLIPGKRLRWIFGIALWIIVASLSTGYWRLFPPSDHPYSWWELYRVKVVLWLLWGAFTPLILEFAARYRVDSSRTLRNALILSVGSIVGTIAYLAVYTVVVILNLVPAEQSETISDVVRFVLASHATFFLLAFWAMVGIEHVLGYYRAYHGQKLEAARLEAQLAESQLTSLRLQLQPHFLFNSLHALGALVRKGETSRAIEMLNGVAELLRASLSGVSRSEITLLEELDLLEHYLVIVRLRFGDQLSITQEIDDALGQAMVPGFLLQPIVENAVRHGIERNGGSGSIRISAERRNDRLALVVENSGANTGDELPKSGNEGIGLSNTAARLQTLYGPQQHVHLESKSSGGACVTIEIPFHEQGRLSRTA